MLALRLLWHALWIHPGYADAQRDLAALTSFFDAGEDIPTEDFHAGDEPGGDGPSEDDRAA